MIRGETSGSGTQLNFTAPNLFTPFVAVVPPVPQGFPAVITRLALRAWWRLVPGKPRAGLLRGD